MEIERQPFAGRLVLIGFGCIGRGVLPLLLRHIALQPQQILVIAPRQHALEPARAAGAEVLPIALTPDNYRGVLGAHLGRGDFLLNLSVDVGSVDLIRLCRERGALYLDTCIEPWAGAHDDPGLSPAQRSNYSLREAALALQHTDREEPTAVVAHGANPGLVSHLLKQALLHIADDMALTIGQPRSRIAWANLARRLQIRVIHIAERDSQVPRTRKLPGEFVNTWSVKGFISEACQPCEIGWGSHEKQLPDDAAQQATGSRAAIYLLRPGANTRVRSWTPQGGPVNAFLITHAESISIADYLGIGTTDQVVYRPTVLYAYHPCDDAVLSLHELVGQELQPQASQRVLKDEIQSGMDELGVLLMGHGKGAYWFGSQLSIDQARRACIDNSATSLQVTAAVMAGVVWAMRNPARGLLEPDDLPHDEILASCRPYLGTICGVYTGWTPLAHRSGLFPQDVDTSDPWQFRNFRIT